MHVFIAGVMQGERLDDQIDSQAYRERIAESLQTHIPDVTITDPWALNPDSVNYDSKTARHTFHSMTKLAGTADLLIAYLPRMSMGTAMEMWEAYQAGVYIIAITPYVHHWAIRFTTDKILPDLESLFKFIENGSLAKIRQSRRAVDGQTVAD